MSTLPSVELGVLGPLQVRQDGAPVTIPGAKPRAILTMLGLHGGSVVAADTLVELLWGEDPPRTAAKALQTHISSLRRTLGDGFVLTAGAGWTLADMQVDAARYRSAARMGRDAAAAGDTSQALARFEEALTLWRGIPELPDGRRGTSEKTRWLEGHAALVEDRADALLGTGRAAEIIGELEAAVADAPLRERRWGQLMLALYRAGRQGEALGAYQRARALLADELGVDPGPELRRLEAAIVAQDSSLEAPAAQQFSSVTRTVTFLLTDIEGSTAAWETEADAMAVALARHDELVEQVVTSRGGRLIKTRGEGDATFSVFERPSGAAAAAIELQDAMVHEPWALRAPIRVRVALHTGEAELRDGDYFGRAVNRAARLRSLATGGQILCSGATAELVIDSLPDDVVLADLGTRQLRNLARPEHVFELQLHTADEPRQAVSTHAPVERPSLPTVLAGPGPFVGRGHELERLSLAWQRALTGGAHAMLIAGEPGVGKTRLAGEWARQAYDQGALVIYGRCDEDLGAPYQPFAEALRSLVPCLGASGLRGLRGVEALLPLVPGLTDVLPDLAAPTRADPDTERYALFDAVIALLGLASASAPVVLILDDLHWAAKPTLLLLRHLLRFGEHARVQIIGTYRSTDLDRSHPLAAMLADLHRDRTADRLALSGLNEDDVTVYVAEAGYNDEELARALASVTGGNPFFLIEALRHVDESGGRWDQSTLPQGVREAVSRRLSRLPAEANKALAAAAVVGSRFALELVERVVGDDLVDAFDEACKAGIVIEEPGGRYRFNHAIVRQSLLAELPSMRRMRLHQRIATTLENKPGADDELLGELAYHYFECAWAGNAAKAVEYCRRAAEQAMARLAYEGAADLYDRALHALDEIDDQLPDRDDQVAALLIARCEALLAAGDVTSAASAVSQLQTATVDSAPLAAWAACFDGQLSMHIHPERLDEVEAAVGAAAHTLAQLGDAAGEAKAHTVRAGCLARLGRIGDCEIALDEALTAARRAREHRRVNAVLANAPLAALWGPNPVPRAGGRCLDVVRLLRITTDSPAVEATSTRCQAVLESFRGRAAAARRMIDSARRTVTELGLRHALSEVEQFAGIIELVADEPAAAEPHLRKAYNGFRCMGLDADTAETAALLGRTCLALDRDAEADELCTESMRLAGHAQKASINWRTLRALLLSRRGDHDEARRVAEEAVGLAERTDALVDHADACLALATVLGAAGDVAGARSAAERAVSLYEQKGAAALTEKARRVVGERDVSTPPAPPPEAPDVKLENACVRVGQRVIAAIHSEAWGEIEELYASEGLVESRRKIVGFKQIDLPSTDWSYQSRRAVETGAMRVNQVVIAVRGERLALVRLVIGTGDVTPGAPYDEFLQLYGIDEDGRIALQLWFDVEDIDAALAELDATHAKFMDEHPPARRVENTATRAFERLWSHFAARDWDAVADTVVDSFSGVDHRRVVNGGAQQGRDAVINVLQVAAEIGFTLSMWDVVAIRGERVALTRVRASGRDPETIQDDALNIVEIDADDRIAAIIVYDLDDFEAAIAELDARFIAGEGAAHSDTWSVVTGTYASISKHEFPAMAPDCVTVDHRPATAFAPGELPAYIRAGWDLGQNITAYVDCVHRLNNFGAVVTYAAYGTSHEGFDGEWHEVAFMTVEGSMVNRCELFNETDLQAAIASFDQLSCPTPRLENAATRAIERFLTGLAVGDWPAIAEMYAEDIRTDDRRRVVAAEVLHGREANVANWRVLTDIAPDTLTSTTIVTRGERLALTRIHSPAFQIEVLNLLEIDADERIKAVVVFDFDDFEAAITELDDRYLAGEAAGYAHTWSVITRAYAALNRREHPATTSNWVNIDHRRGLSFAPGHVSALLTNWLATPHLHNYIEAVHRLDDLGAVVTSVTHETSREGFEAEWRGISILTIDGQLVNRLEVFDEAELDAAIVRFEELHPQAVRLENAASQTHKRLQALFAARDWDAISVILADDIATDDRRRTVNAGVRKGRNAVVEELSATLAIGVESLTSDVFATRGGRLALCRTQTWGRDKRPEAFHTDVFDIVALDADGQLVARIVFDLDDLDAAMAELDARYIAGEAAPHAQTWSVITQAYAAFNGHELPSTTPDWVNIDHRRGRAFSPGDLIPYIRATWELTPQAKIYVETVHRVSDLGAVVTQSTYGTSPDGFDVEWVEVVLLTTEGDLINRIEVFDETDLDTAIARFDQLNQPAPRLENAASQVAERVLAHVVARNWGAIAELFADNFSSDDRRRVVGAGIQHGRDAEIADLRAMLAIGDLRLTTLTPTVIATRGERLVLLRAHLRFTDRDQEQQAFLTDALAIVELDADGRMVTAVSFDLEDFHAAIAELDARYLAGETAAQAKTWSVITASYAAINRHEQPPITPDWVNVDHRREIAMGPSDLMAYMSAGLDADQDVTSYVATVHRLNSGGAVVTYAAQETSRDGFDAEWRGVAVLVVDGERVSRIELFDEADVDAAIARFDQLDRPAPGLENAASRMVDHFLAHFAARGWDAMAELVADDFCSDDRRPVINAGIRRGRDVEMENWRATADVWMTDLRSTVIATRGERLTLSRFTFASQDSLPAASQAAALSVIEVNDDDRAAATVVFDPDDISAAFEELETRYCAAEAAAHADTWSVIASSYAAFNRHELPTTTPEWVTIDHRRGTPFERSNLNDPLRAIWDLTPDLNIHIEAVHRLENSGAVITHMGHATSPDGFEAEWRAIDVLMVEGDLINRCEVFDETDIDAALARFDELSQPRPRLENAATRLTERFFAYFRARLWAGLAEILADECSINDRRHVVNAGLWDGRGVVIANMQALNEGGANITWTVTATRGERLALLHICSSNRDLRHGEFGVEMLGVAEIDTNERMTAHVLFDIDDIDAAFEELDGRYLAGEAAAHARTWLVIAQECAAFNRHELPAADWATVDHRSLVTIDANDLLANIRASWDLMPELKVHIEAVHRLSSFGAIVTYTAHGTSAEGFDAEWRMIHLLTVQGDRINRSELFDEADLDAAIARFDELQPEPRRLENAASRADERLVPYFEAHNWQAMAELLADDFYSDDRRHAVNYGLRPGRDVAIANMQASADLGLTFGEPNVIATRGERLVLTRARWQWSGPDQAPAAFHTEVLNVVEVNTDERVASRVMFDLNEIDAAFAELDARYVAGEAAAHAHVWSVIAHECAAFNRHEVPAADWVTIDHRQLAVIDAREGQAAMRDIWEITPNLNMHIETVHRLGSSGAVSSYVATGTSSEGVDAEWPMILLLTVEGDRINRCEVFDEADLDAALARFDELGNR